ncbi:MAG: hypothetical protein ACFFDF_21600 [Candidatus Odinarchaeota archaeon]
MMSLETPVEVKIAKEFLVAKELLSKVNFEIIGTKDVDNETFYLVRIKKS